MKKDIDKLIEKGKLRDKKKSFVKFCPNCGSTRIDVYSYVSEAWDRCIDCGFHSRGFPEKEKK